MSSLDPLIYDSKLNYLSEEKINKNFNLIN